MSDTGQSLARARAMLDVRHNAEAVALLSQTVAADPGDGTAWCLLSLAQLRCDNHASAVEAAHRAIALAPSDAWAHRLLSLAQLNMGWPQAAVVSAAEACRLAPQDWQAWVCQALAVLGTHYHLEAAEMAAAEARRLAPDEAEVHYVLGRVSFARKQLPQATLHLERALALDPMHSGALNELGRINLKRRKAAGAAAHFIQAARSAPNLAVYSRNVEIAVRNLVGRLIYFTTLGCWIFVVFTVGNASRAVPVIGLSIIAVASAGLVAVRLRQMPPATRPLFRSRRIMLAMGTVFGAILLTVIVAAAAPRAWLGGGLALAGVLVLASRFIAYAILRRKPRGDSIL